MVSFALWMKKRPYREATIRSTLSCVKSIARRSILDNQESVQEYIATANVSDNRKCILVDAVALFNVDETPPHFKLYIIYKVPNVGNPEYNRCTEYGYVR